ncbi:SEC-C metal-binding domain-containing protein [Lentibacillus sp. N15]|uniref:SEC-C metal-binding domain-containing protein n=1 Tax=Lentibacillus songyuanensis TaxID=3136161 RepID=UPI0031B9F8C2
MERFHILTEIARNGGYHTFPNLNKDQIEYFRTSGIVYSGTFAGKKVLALPDELIDSVLPLESDPNVTSIVQRNTEWIKLTLGLLYYYGTLSIFKLEEMVKMYTGTPLDIPTYLTVMHRVNSYHNVFHSDEDGFSNIRVFDPKRVKKEHQMRKDLPFYPFKKGQLMKAGEPGFVERNKSYVQFVHFLTQNYEMNKQEADGLVEECVYATRIGDSPNDVLQFLGGTLEFTSMESVQALMNQVIDLMNHTREWFLKGYMSSELRNQETLRPLPASRPPLGESSKKQVKVGRNDPCPCGSGKNIKNAVGDREVRLVWHGLCLVWREGHPVSRVTCVPIWTSSGHVSEIRARAGLKRAGTRPKRARAGLKRAGTRPKRARAGLKRAGTRPKRARAGLKRAGTRPKRARAGLKRAGTRPKRARAGLKRARTRPKRAGASQKRAGTRPKRARASQKRPGYRCFQTNLFHFFSSFPKKARPSF